MAGLRAQLSQDADPATAYACAQMLAMATLQSSLPPTATPAATSAMACWLIELARLTVPLPAAAAFAAIAKHPPTLGNPLLADPFAPAGLLDVGLTRRVCRPPIPEPEFEMDLSRMTTEQPRVLP